MKKLRENKKALLATRQKYQPHKLDLCDNLNHFDENQAADFITRFSLNDRNKEALLAQQRKNMMNQFYHDFHRQLEMRKEMVE